MKFSELEVVESAARFTAERAERRQAAAAIEVVYARDQLAAYPASCDRRAALVSANDEFSAAVLAAVAARAAVVVVAKAAAEAWNREMAA